MPLLYGWRNPGIKANPEVLEAPAGTGTWTSAGAQGSPQGSRLFLTHLLPAQQKGPGRQLLQMVSIELGAVVVFPRHLNAFKHKGEKAPLLQVVTF